MFKRGLYDIEVSELERVALSHTATLANSVIKIVSIHTLKQIQRYTRQCFDSLYLNYINSRRLQTWTENIFRNYKLRESAISSTHRPHGVSSFIGKEWGLDFFQKLKRQHVRSTLRWRWSELTQLGWQILPSVRDLEKRTWHFAVCACVNLGDTVISSTARVEEERGDGNSC